MREQDFITWICSQSGFDPEAVPVGPGDDMAVVTCGRQRILIAVDQALDGVHFVLSEDGPAAAGRKAMARSLSDVAAMAAVPLAAVACVALPKGFARGDAEAIYRSIRSTADEFRCPLVGGDVGAWADSLAVSVTVLARPGGAGAILRSGAKAGDAICVTGQFGAAWRSRRHLSFTPRIAEAIALADRVDLHAMIDVSDGLAADLAHVCEASGVGATVFAEHVPIHPDARTHCPAGPLAAALGDGEDYELLFALDEQQARRIVRDQPLDTPITRIGAIVGGRALTLVHAGGRTEKLRPHGWEHET